MEITLNPVAINIYLTILQNPWLTYFKPIEKHELELAMFKTHRSHIWNLQQLHLFDKPMARICQKPMRNYITRVIIYS